jgi:crotonobetainyl-CoA:carnitine CoA-transferase CaiB-like acyl-CoA transferase
LSRTPCSIRREAPEFGQHTEEILTEVLGYTWDDIAKLKEAEVI